MMNNSMKRGTWLLALWGICLFSTAVSAQNTISGKVTNQQGEALPGVNIIQMGTSTGVVTNIDGYYKINASDDASLIFSFIGYKVVEEKIGNRTVIDVQLQPDAKQLSEVVVVGYGTSAIEDVTGAVVSVKAKDFNQGVIASPEQLFQGRLAGVGVTTASGEPGGVIDVRVRGTSSIRSGNNPLFVIDGIPLSGDDITAGNIDFGFGLSTPKNPLNFLNPNDIASVDVLKDASATAIYGSRGANGVILITTKNGEDTAGRLTYQNSFGVSKVAKNYDLLNREEFLEAAANIDLDASAFDDGADTDWQDEIYRTAFTQNHDLSFSSSNDQGYLRFSLSYYNQEGVVERSGLERLTARFNGTQKYINDRLTLKTQLTVSDIHDQNVPITNDAGFEGDLMGMALYGLPISAVRNSGDTLIQRSTTQINPVALLELSRDNTNTLKFLGGFSFDFQVNDYLKFSSNFGLDRSVSARKAAFSRDLLAKGIFTSGRAGFIDIFIDNRLIENYLTLDKKIGDRHQLNAVLGYSYQNFDTENKILAAQNFRTSDLGLMLNNLGSVDASFGIPIIGNTSNIEDELQSYFGRVNYALKDKYRFTATLRADGSSKFGKNNRYGYFPSLGASWSISEERFASQWSSMLKLRLGWGITGNQEIPHNLHSERQRYQYKTGRFEGFNDGGGLEAGGLNLLNVAFTNPDLKWESTTQFNVGLDFGIFDGSVTGSLEYYHKNTNDLLLRFTSAQPAPNDFFWDNLDADIINQGIDLSLNASILEKSLLRWDATLNLGFNDNKVKNLRTFFNTGELDGDGLTGSYTQRIADGQPLYAYFLRDFIGFNEAGGNVFANGGAREFTGDSPLPKVNIGLTNNVGYKSFSLSAFFTGQFGHKVYNNTANAYFVAGILDNSKNVTKDVVSSGESVFNTPGASTRFLEDGAFVRLQNLSLAYNVNVNNIDFINGLTVSLIGQNLFVITNYSGLDPEVNIDKSRAGVPSFGIDYTAYPRARTWSAAIQVTF